MSNPVLDAIRSRRVARNLTERPVERALLELVLDAARWALGVGFPDRVSAMGGHFMFDDDQQTPNTLSCTFIFERPNEPRKLLEFGVRHWITNNEADFGVFIFFTAVVGDPHKAVDVHCRFVGRGDGDVIGFPRNAAGKIRNLNRRFAVELAAHVPIQHLRLVVRKGGV